MLEQIATALGVKSTGLVAGFFGALVSLKFLPEVRTRAGLAFVVLGGTLCASYVAPGVAEWLGAGKHVEGAMTFAIGLFGMTLAGKIINAIGEMKISESIASWFKRPGS